MFYKAITEIDANEKALPFGSRFRSLLRYGNSPPQDQELRGFLACL
jgi:hypothetical protein